MRPKELRDLTVEELKDKHKEYKKELYNLRFQHAIGQLSNTARITEVKRIIARILTIMREKETGRDRSSVLS
ncbi:50S ribosomal protein L29 [Acetomicrobium sp.]|jgi:large subunit ribosomal protein L29|uniref:50S ribosomal protein L29 n=1 Tax=Acetomicrobium sp. TaxID=1872099 RepID=UPI002872353B|nr:50S ribosomal protein L29 [Acetomicrobium sp.]MDR9770361.1 50S ribosomal protein L29 [Acetomicrobium sp.]HPT65235.1 50S ribosomal protein L29 [Acetomicrobium sp.]HXK99028.1 50S ribosomal protein L29 [Acetomicrobium sp.]